MILRRLRLLEVPEPLVCTCGFLGASVDFVKHVLDGPSMLAVIVVPPLPQVLLFCGSFCAVLLVSVTRSDLVSILFALLASV